MTGHVPACLFLADVLVKENQRAEAMRWLKRAERQGSLDAHEMLLTMAPLERNRESMSEL